MPSTRRLRTDLFIATFLAIQVLLPLRGCVWDKLDTRADFSWNMYSQEYRCRIRYRFHPGRGPSQRILHKGFFRRETSAAKTFHRDRLPELHAFMCEQLTSGREGAWIEGDVACSVNFGPRVALVEPGTDICHVANHGVR